MKIRLGFEITYDCPQPTPMILTLSVHYLRISDLIVPDHLVADPPVPMTAYRDTFGNWCSRIVAPKGTLRLSTDAVVNDSGLPDIVASDARQTPVDAAGRHAAVPARQSLLRDRPAVRRRMATVSARRRRGGRGFRRSAITCIGTSRSTTNTRASRAPRGRRCRTGPACAATMRTSPSRSAAA